MSYPNPLNMRAIVCRELGIPTTRLQSRSRARVIVAARHTIAAAAVLFYDRSWPEAAEIAGFNGHASTGLALKHFKAGKYNHYPICKQFWDRYTEDQS